jgi:hypothetical protein
MKWLKNFNWSNTLWILAIVLIAVLFVVPLVKPLVQKIPFLGKYAS